MLTPKDFLVQECQNVQSLLKEALRYNYGPRGSEVFYNQCFNTANLFQQDIDSCSPTNDSLIFELSTKLSTLSALIATVERAHIGEFSWACGEALRCHADVLCKDNFDYEPKAGTPPPAPDKQPKKPKRSKSLEEPLVYFLAEGGTSSYSETTWHDQIGNAARRVFTITVPRTMRHHVLIHAVIAHEVGHAFHTVPAQQKLIEEAMADLTANSVLADSAKLATLPIHGDPDLQSVLENKDAYGELTRNWTREIIADLFGLTLMGPAFLGALRSLFGGLNPDASEYDAEHPPDNWRFEALQRAYARLGWNVLQPTYSGELLRAHQKFHDEVLEVKDSVAGVTEVFYGQVIEDIVDKIRAKFDELQPGLVYSFPDGKDFAALYDDLLNFRPPTGWYIKKDGSIEDLKIDYRNILHAGWISLKGMKSETISPEHFLRINRLCEQAITQRQAIIHWLEASVSA